MCMCAHAYLPKTYRCFRGGGDDIQRVGISGNYCPLASARLSTLKHL